MRNLAQVQAVIVDLDGKRYRLRTTDLQGRCHRDRLDWLTFRGLCQEIVQCDRVCSNCRRIDRTGDESR